VGASVHDGHARIFRKTRCSHPGRARSARHGSVPGQAFLSPAFAALAAGHSEADGPTGNRNNIATRQKKKTRHRAGLFGSGISRIRQLEQYLAVTGLGCAPAREILAAQFR
jgi:hypothetical protein